MKKKYFGRISVVALALTVCFSTQARIAGHDADKKVTKEQRTALQLGPNVPVPQRYSGKDNVFKTKRAPRMLNYVEMPGAKARKAIPQRVDPVAPLRGCVTYDAANTFYGMVEFSATGLTKVREHEGLQAAYGGTSFGQYYYNTCAEVSGGTILDVEAYVWDPAQNWRMIGYSQMPGYDVVAYSMCSDPVTDVIYGVFISSDGSGLEFGTMDGMSMTRTSTICKVEKPLYGMGFNGDGTLYGIDSEGVLYKIDVKTGGWTKLKETGLDTAYLTSGTVDPRTGIFYYALITENEDDWALYTIDLNNDYKVERAYGITVEPGGFYVANAAAPSQAPGAPTALSVDYANGALQGTVRFTAPTTLFNGDVASGSVKYNIIYNDQVIATGSTTYGANVEAQVTAPAKGKYNVRVFMSNDAGNGPKGEAVELWIGNGAPLSPANPTLAYDADKGTVVLNWDAVTKAEMDAYIDPAKVTYTVHRVADHGDDTIVAANLTTPTYTDAVDRKGGLQLYQYTVEAVFDQTASAPTAFNNLLVGAATPPLDYQFVDAAETDYFTVVGTSTNAYASYSEYDEALQYVWNNYPAKPINDYIISAPLALTKGKVYDVDLSVFTNSYSAQAVELVTGTAPTAEALTQVVMESTVVNSRDWRNPVKLHGRLEPQADGVYYVAVHFASTASNWSLLIDDWKVSEPYGLNAPDRVTDVSFTPDYEGTPVVDIAFTAPRQTVSGKTLTTISRIDIVRDGTVVKTFPAPAFGAKFTYTDRAPRNADYTYTIQAYNNDGTGLPYTTVQHVGVNLAAAPLNCVMSEDPNNPGMVTVSWTPVAKDINGNDINPSLIQYAVLNDDGQTALAQGIPSSEPQVRLRLVDAGRQIFKYLYVLPVTVAGANGYHGGYGVTNMEAVGTPYPMPFRESFADQQLHYNWANTNGNWRPSSTCFKPQVNAQDGDEGLLYWQPLTGAGATTTLYSGKIGVENADDVALDFYYAGLPGVEGYRFQPYVICEGEKKALCQPIATGEAIVNGWNNVRLSLAEYAGKSIQLEFDVICVSYEGFFAIDNINVRRYCANDLAATGINLPKTMTVGQPATVVANIYNDGYMNATPFEVNLMRNGKVVETAQVMNLEAFNVVGIDFAQTPGNFWGEKVDYAAKAVWADDQQQGNNTSDYYTMAIDQSPYPEVTDLAATLDEATNKVTLTWSEPDHAPKTYEVTEDFESYDSFTITDFGNWTLVDGDGRGDYEERFDPWGKTPRAWQVWDQEAGKLWYDTAHGGNKSAKAMCVRGEADNWLISPELAGCAQTVTFYAMTACEEYGPEEFEFYYSTTGKEIADFIQLGDREEVPEGDYEEDEYGDEEMVATWYKYEYQLPAGTKYFAIRHVSDDLWAMYVDDITYTVQDAPITLLGYNIYRNGEKINGDSPVTDTTFTDTLAEPGNYTYHVEAVYHVGPGKISNNADVTIAKQEPDDPKGGIDGVTTVTTLHGDVYDVYGRLVRRGPSTEGLAAGIYIVGGTKVAVK